MARQAVLRLVAVAAFFVGAAGPPAMAQDSGDPLKAYRDGKLFDQGQEAYRDGYFELAFRVFLIEAARGNVEARYRIGLMYANGEGVPRDDEDAVLSFRQAAEKGHARAQAHLGTMYFEGEGVTEDFVTGYAWVSVAAAQNLDAARKAKEIIAKAMSRSQIARAEELSRDFRARYVLPFR